MNHRKLRRFLTLSASCVASLCAGAYLSYQASMQQESALRQTAATEQVAVTEQIAAAEPITAAGQAVVAEKPAEIAPAAKFVAENPAAENPPAEQRAAEPPVMARRDSAANETPPANTPSFWLRVSLPVDREPLVASVTARPPLDPSKDGSRSAPDELRHDKATEQAAPADSASPPVQPDVLASLESPLPALAPLPDKAIPLPPRRPSSLSAAVAPPVTIPAPQQVAALPPSEVPAAPQPVAAPAVAAVAPPPPPVATLAPPATSPVVEAPPPAAPRQNAAIAAAPVAAPQPASGSNQFPGIASALAAVTASVGAANTPLPPSGDAAQVSPEPSGGFKKGSPVYVRIFKQEGALELWIKRGESYALYKTFPICKWSGQLGPKTRTSDYQSPEGFYSVSARQLNPNSHYHLAFDVGYPNAFDRRQGSTGSAVMVHGDCKSVGCFAMTNNGIEEIYGIVAAALAGGQREVPVHIFPFRMTETAIARESAPRSGNVLAFLAAENSAPQRDWSPFWRNLKQGYDLFERSHVPPVAFACGDRYEFGGAGRSCARIAGW